MLEIDAHLPPGALCAAHPAPMDAIWWHADPARWEIDPATGELLVGGWSRTSAQSGFSAATVWRVAPDGGAATRVVLPSEGGAD